VPMLPVDLVDFLKPLGGSIPALLRHDNDILKSAGRTTRGGSQNCVASTRSAEARQTEEHLIGRDRLR
jgi:hypothetical protein